MSCCAPKNNCDVCSSINSINSRISATNAAINTLIQQQQTTINILNNGGTPTPGGPIPDNLFLHVSTLGNNTTGNGSLASPYLTLDRAVQDVFNIGWNNSAEIRILSTGGIFQWPTNLNIESGGRGLQKSPLVIRGFNTNTNPGRTTVFNQSVTSATSDPRSQIITITGPGPYTSAQLGQLIRFTSGAYTTFPAIPSTPPGFLGTVQVNVPIVEIVDATTIRIAFTSPVLPAINDTFVIESLDTIVNVPIFSSVRALDRIVLEDIQFISPSGPGNISGLMFEGGNFAQLKGINIISTGSFVLVGYESTTITGGNVLVDIGVNAFAPTTKSLFVNTTGGFFANRPSPGSEYSAISFKFAGFIGNGDFSSNGSISQSYFNGISLRITTDTCDVSNVWFNNASLSVGSEGKLNATSVHITNGQFNTNGVSTVSYNGITLEDATIFFENSRVDGSDTFFSGTNPSGLPLISLTATTFFHRNTLFLNPNLTSDGIQASLGSILNVLGDITASNFTGGGRSGIVANDSSVINAQGNITCNSNGFNGVNLNRNSELVCGGTLSTISNQTGIAIQNSRIQAGFQINSSNNSFIGISIANDSHIAAFSTIASNNAQTNIGMFFGSSLLSDNITADTGASVNSVQVSNLSQILARTLNINNTTGASLLVDNDSKVTITDSASFSFSTPAFGAGVTIQNSSKLVVSNLLTSSNHNSSGLLITNSSSLNVSNLQLQSNQGSGLTVSNSSSVNAFTISSSNNITAGVLVTTHSNLAAISFIDSSTNGSNGLTVSSKSNVFADQLVSSAGANTGFGAQTNTSSKIKVATNSSMLGTIGDAQVGVNAVTSWANIATQNPAFITDYLSGQNPTQLCEIA